MVGRAMALAFMLGTGVVQQMARILPASQQMLLLGAAVVLLLCGAVCSGALKSLRPVLWVAAFGLLGVWNASWQAQDLLTQQLPLQEENKPFKLTVQIESLVRLQPDSRSFVVRVLEARPEHVPEFVSLRWSAQEWGGPYVQPK